MEQINTDDTKAYVKISIKHEHVICFERNTKTNKHMTNC